MDFPGIVLVRAVNSTQVSPCAIFNAVLANITPAHAIFAVLANITPAHANMCAYLLEFECSQGKAVKTSQPDNALLISHPLPGFHTEGGRGGRGNPFKLLFQHCDYVCHG